MGKGRDFIRTMVAELSDLSLIQKQPKMVIIHKV